MEDLFIFIDNEASQLEVAFDLHVEKIESKLQEWKMKTLSQAARTAFSGGATLWPGWSQDHLDLEQKFIYNNLKFYIYLSLKKFLEFFFFSKTNFWSII